MHVMITPALGESLQRIIRRGKNPIAVRRAEILLESALGATPQDLSRRYHLPVPYLHELIRAFNHRGTAAIHAGTRGKASIMTPEERSILVEAGRLTPHAFGFDHDVWALSHLQRTALERQWVRFADLDSIRSAFREAGIPFRDEEKDRGL